MIRYIVLFSNMIFDYNVLDGESLNVPPAASRITETDWTNMVIAAGSEDALLAQLGITEDNRDNE